MICQSLIFNLLPFFTALDILSYHTRADNFRLRQDLWDYYNVQLVYAVNIIHFYVCTHRCMRYIFQMKQVQARKKVAKMVMAFVIVFAVCFFPQHVFMLWFYIHPTAQKDYNAFWHYFRILGFCLAFTNSCINPIALYCVSGTFRKYFDR